MSDESEPAPPKKLDIAAQSGRIAGRIVGGLGGMLLRTRPVREAVRRGHDEATKRDAEPGGETPPPAS